MKNYILTGFADEIDPMMNKQYALLKKLGISHIELRGVNGKNISKLSLSEVTDLKLELDENGFKTSAIGSPVGKIKITEDFSDHFDMFLKLISFAKVLETKYIRIFSFYTDGDYDTHRDEIFARMQMLVDEAKRNDIVLLLENEKGIYGDKYERVQELAERFYCDNLKLTFDFANFVQCGSDTLKAFDALERYIEYVHIKDALFDVGHVVPAGLGDGNIKVILDRLFAKGYSGFLSLEPHLSHFHGLDALENGEICQTEKIPGDIAFTTAYDALMKILK